MAIDKLFLLLLMFATFFCMANDAKLDVFETDERIYFIVSAKANKNVNVLRESLSFSSGLKVFFEKDGVEYISRTHDNYHILRHNVEVENSALIGRVTSKQMISFFFGIKDVGFYKMTAKMCISESICTEAITKDIKFEKDDFIVMMHKN